jgi:ATP synthase protein I
VIVSVTLLSLFRGFEFAGAVFVGGLICSIPNMIFARSWFSFFSARYPQQMLIMFYFSEVVKFFLMATLFLLVFKFLAVGVLPTLLGFASGQAGLFLGSMIKHKS